MVAHVAANRCHGRAIKQLILMQLTTAELWILKKTSIGILKAILNYIMAYVRECLVVFRDLFTPLCPASLFASFSQGQAEKWPCPSKQRSGVSPAGPSQQR